MKKNYSKSLNFFVESLSTLVVSSTGEMLMRDRPSRYTALGYYILERARLGWR